MGFFRKSPAEKKLNELTSSDRFTQLLKSHGLDESYGETIKKQMLSEIKKGNLGVDGIETRLSYLIKVASPKTMPDDSKQLINCPNCNHSILSTFDKCPYCDYSLTDEAIECPVCGEKNAPQEILCTKCGYDFINKTETKKCPKCQSRQNNDNKICTKCGYDFENSRKCPECGFDVDKNTSVCPNCEYDLDRKVFTKVCPKCGKRIEKDDKFCMDCGYSFNNKKCPKCGSEENVDDKFCMQCGYDFTKTFIKDELLNDKRSIKYLYNQKHNLKTCPECGCEYIISDKYCYNCGISNKKVDAFEIDNDISELEELYSKSVSSKYAPNFKFAYVLYLDSYGKSYSKRYEIVYRTSEDDLFKQALDDEYLIESSPIASANLSTVSELKEILKQNDLKVSGRKDELIKRLDDNLGDDELSEVFPQKAYEVSKKGLDFVHKNRYVLYYDKNYSISQAISVNDFEMIFRGADFESDRQMYDLIIKNLKKGENDINMIESLAILYKDIGDDLNLLDSYFKIFIYRINYENLKEDEIYQLNNLIHHLSLDINSLKEKFENAYDVFKDTRIKKEECFMYLLKLFSGANVYEINEEINRKFFAFD